jgi:DNA-damage-inducible protein J
VVLWHNIYEVIIMANTTTYNIRVDSNIRNEADALYKSMGMTLSQAVNLFLTQSVAQGRLPIAEIVPQPGYRLIRAMEEADRIGSDPDRKRFDTAQEMFAAMDAEDESENGDA